MQLQAGMVICAIAGKERGGYYVVTKLEDGYVYLADGKHRKLETPKRKNVKHIRFTSQVWNVETLTNRELRRKLRECNASWEEDSLV